MHNFENYYLESFANRISNRFLSYELRPDSSAEYPIHIIGLTYEQAQFLRNNFNKFQDIGVTYEIAMSNYLYHPMVGTTKFNLTIDNLLEIQGSIFVIEEIVSRIWRMSID